MTAKEYEVSFRGDENILELDSGHVMVTKLCEYTKPPNFMACELYLNF